MSSAVTRARIARRTTVRPFSLMARRTSTRPSMSGCRTPDRMRPMSVDVPRLFASRRVRWVFIAASVLGLIIGIDTLILHLRLDPVADVRAYYDAGARLNAGQPLYIQPATTDDASFYRYPPLLAIAFRPLALLPYETAALIWEVFLVSLFILTIAKTGTRNKWTWIVLGW